MKSKWFLLVKAVISIVVGFFLLFFPRMFLNWFLKFALTPATEWSIPEVWDVMKLGFGYFGAMLVGIAIICYFASSATASALRKKVILGLAVGDSIGFILTLIPMWNGLLGYSGYILILLWLVLALFLFYFFFTEKTD